MLEKRIELKEEDFGKKYSGEYLFVSMGWGATNRLAAECTKINPANKQTLIDMKMLNARTLMATMLKKPKIMTLEHLLDETSEGLPPALGEFLMTVADYVNGYSVEERVKLKNLKEQWNLD